MLTADPTAEITPRQDWRRPSRRCCRPIWMVQIHLRSGRLIRLCSGRTPAPFAFITLSWERRLARGRASASSVRRRRPGLLSSARGNRNCVPRLGGTSADELDAIGDRLMSRLAYRNFNNHESLVGNFTVSSGGVAARRWFELRDVTSGTPTTFQERRWRRITGIRWMPQTSGRFPGGWALQSEGSSAASVSLRFVSLRKTLNHHPPPGAVHTGSRSGCD